MSKGDRRTLALVMLVLASLQGPTATATSSEQGEFRGRVVVEWIVNSRGVDREMRLLEDFEFEDAAGRPWKVPSATVVDGASIPKALWSILDSPFVGSYRRASVVHDYYCQEDQRHRATSREVHRMFLDAMLAGGVPFLRAQAMYLGVRWKGPDWDHVEVRGSDGRTELVVQAHSRGELTDEDVNDIEKWLRETSPGLEELDEFPMLDR